LLAEQTCFIRGEQPREQARTRRRGTPALPDWERLTRLPPRFEDLYDVEP
jgi:general secretion pathway protein D